MPPQQDAVVESRAPPALQHNSSIITGSVWTSCFFAVLFVAVQAIGVAKTSESEAGAHVAAVPYVTYLALCLPLLLWRHARPGPTIPDVLANVHLLLLVVLPVAFVFVDSASEGLVVFPAVGAMSPLTAAATARRPGTALTFLGLHLGLTAASITWLAAAEVLNLRSILYAASVSVSVSIYGFLLVAYVRREITVQSEAYKQLLCSMLPAKVAQESYNQLLAEASQSYRYIDAIVPGVPHWVSLGGLTKCFPCLRAAEDDNDGDESVHYCRPSSAWAGPNKVAPMNSDSGEGFNPLQVTSTVRPRHHGQSAVIFADIVGFSTMCEGASAPVILAFMQRVVAVMDEVAERYGVTKIRTIGDCFMGVSGLMAKYGSRIDAHDYSMRAVLFGLDLQRKVRDIEMPNGEPLRLRVGISAGRMVSGVIGCSQPQFDIYGRLVNFAARLEQSCSTGCVHVSGLVFKDLKTSLEKYEFSHQELHCNIRRNLELKGLGMKDTVELSGEQSPEFMSKLKEVRVKAVRKVATEMSLQKQQVKYGWSTKDMRISMPRRTHDDLGELLNQLPL